MTPRACGARRVSRLREKEKPPFWGGCSNQFSITIKPYPI